MTVFTKNLGNSSVKRITLIDVKQTAITELERFCNCSVNFFEDNYEVADNKHPIMLILPKNHYLNSLIIELLQYLSAGGILQQSVNYHSWMLFKKVFFEPPQEPQVLTVDDLSFGFILWLASCGISFIPFIFELIGPTLFRLSRKLIGLICFLTLLFMRQRHRVGA